MKLEHENKVSFPVIVIHYKCRIASSQVILITHTHTHVIIKPPCYASPPPLSHTIGHASESASRARS
jgi:hypothetical protein